MRSVDVSTHIKDAALLHGLLDELIQDIRLQHVVKVIMDNTANYVLVGKMLMDEDVAALEKFYNESGSVPRSELIYYSKEFDYDMVY